MSQNKWNSFFDSYLKEKGLKRDDDDEGENYVTVSSGSNETVNKAYELHTDGRLKNSKWKDVFVNYVNDANAKDYNKRIEHDRWQQFQRNYFQQKEIEKYNNLSDEGKLEYNVDKAKQAQEDFLNKKTVSTSLWDGLKSLAPGGVKPSEWYNTRKTEKRLQDTVNDTQSALDYHQASEKQAQEEDKLRKLDTKKLSAYIDDLEKQKDETYGRVSGALKYIGAGLQGDSEGAADIHEKNQENYKKRDEIDRKLKIADDVISQRQADRDLRNLTDDELKIIDNYNNIKEFSANHGLMETYKAEQAFLGLGYDNIYEIANERKKQVDKQRAQELEDDSHKFAQEHPVIASAAARAISPAAAFAGALGHLEESLSGNKYLDTNNPYYDFTRIKNSLDETVSANMESGGILSRNTKAFLYQTAASGIDSISNAAVGGAMGAPLLGEALLGAGAMNDTVLDVAEKGGTKSEALLSGLIAGVNESLFEHLSLSQLRAFKEVPVKKIKDAIGNIGKSIITNFSEEAATEIANITSDYYINGGLSDCVQSVEKYIENGLSEDEAKRKACVDMSERITQAGLGGALMGGAFGVGGTIAGQANYQGQLRKEGESIAQDGSSIEKLVAGASDIDGADADFSKLRDKVENSEGYRAYLKSLQNQSGEGEIEPVGAESIQYKNSDYRNIGRLAQSLGERTNEDIKQTVKSGVAERLSALGEDESKIESLSQVITKKLQGEELTSKERKQIVNSKYARRVVNEYSTTQREMYSSDWANSVDKKATDLFNRRYNPDVEAFRTQRKLSTTDYSSDNSKAESEGGSTAQSEKSIKQIVSDTKGQYTNYASALIEPLYNDGQEHSPVAFERSFAQFYEYGKAGYDFEKIKDNITADLNFSQKAKQEAFAAGVNAQKIGTSANKVTGISAITDGDIVVSDSSGERVSLSQANLSDNMMSLYKNAATYKDVAAANSYISGYREGVSLKSYDKAFSDFYAAGISSRKSFDSFLRDNNDYSSLLKIVPENVAKEAFDFGGKLALQNSKAAQSGKNIKRNAQGTFQNQTVSNEVLDSFYEAVAAKTKLNIVKRDTVFSNDGREANAQFIAKTFTVMISANADSEFTDMVHELNHATSAANSKGYAQVAQAVVSWYTEQNGYSSFEERLKEIADTYGDISRTDAIEEFVSESVAGLFSTDEGVSDFMKWLQTDSGYSKASQKTILQKLADVFKQIVETIKSLISNGQLSDTAKEFAKVQADKASKIRQMFLEALDGSQGGTVESSRAESKDSKKIKRKSYYDEFSSLGMQWAYSEQTKIGDTKDLFNPKENRVVTIEATKDDIGFRVIDKQTFVSKKVHDGRVNGVTSGIRDYDGSFSERFGRISHSGDAVEQRRSNVRDGGFSQEQGLQTGQSDKKGDFRRDVEIEEKVPFDRRGRSSENERGTEVVVQKVEEETQNSLKRTDNSEQGVSQELQEDNSEKLSYSLGIKELRKQNRSLIRQNKNFEETIDRLKRQIQNPQMRHFVDFDKTKAVARKFKTEYASTLNVNDIATQLGNFYDMIANSKQPNWDVISTNAMDIAENIVKASKNMKPEISEFSKNVLRDIRSVGVSLSDEQKQEVVNRFGSYNEFRKATFGSLNLRKDGNGVALDTRWAELADSYPGIFDKEASEADQGVLLFEAVRALKNTYNDDSGFDFESARDMLAAEIYEAYFEVPETQSLSNDYERKLANVKLDYRQQLDEAKRQFKNDNVQMLIAARKEFGQNLADVRKQYDEQLLRNKARYEQRVQNIADTNTRAQMRKNIVRRVKRLDVLLRKPNNSNNIPEGFQSAVLNLCDMFTNDTSVFDYERLDDVRKAYASIRANSKGDETSISGSYDFDIESDLERLKKELKGKRLSQLSASQLETVRDVLDHFSAVIKNETEIFVDGKKQFFENVGSKALREMQSRGIKKSRIGDNPFKTMLLVDDLTPTYAFKNIGGTLEKLYGDIRKGQDKYVTNLTPAKEFIADTMKKYQTSSWLKKDGDVLKLKTSRGETLSFTREQALLVYATAKRERLSGQESKHLLSGGIVYENQIKPSGKGKEKGKPWEYKTNDKNAHPLSLEDIVKICDFLTPQQKSYADEMVNYLSNDMAELGNEVSMNLYGIRKFKERYYIPFNSADSFGYRRFGESFDSRLKNMSMTKATVKGASTPLVLSDFTEVCANHIERMSAYNALVIPLENFTRVWNYKMPTTDTEASATVSSAFESAMGTDFKNYVEQLMKDVNGNIMNDRRGYGIDSLVRKFKKNAVFASMSVTIQQPSAVARAFALVDPKYFVKTTFSKRDWEECKRYAPVAVIKEIGGFDTASGRNMVDWMIDEKPNGFKEKFKAFFSLKDSSYRDDILSMGPEFADQITWSHIWNAVKEETRAKTGLSGEALLVKSGERFSEVVDKTQVYDSVLSRSGLMRSKDNLTKAVTAFMAEPTLSFNILLDGVKQAKSGDKRYGARVFAAFTVNTLFNAMLKSIVTAARDDDDDKSQFEKYIAELVANFINDMNPLSLMPFMKDVISVFQGYDVSRADMSLVSDFADSIKTITNSNKSFYQKVTAFAGAIGGFIGVPARNILRDLNALSNTIKGLSSGNKTTAKGIEQAIEENSFQILRTFKLYSDPTKAERLFDAWTDGDKETYNQIAQSYKNGQAVKNALVGQIKQEYIDGGIDKDEAIALLERFDYDYDKASEKLDQAKEKAQGSTEGEEEQEDKNAKYKDFDSLR